jgi:hypothetical protein
MSRSLPVLALSGLLAALAMLPAQAASASGAAATPRYEAPAAPGPGMPATPASGAPATPRFRTPAAPRFRTPATPRYGVPAAAASGAAAQACTGTDTAPGVLAGRYPGNVIVKGLCVVDAGPAIVKDNLTIAPGGALLANFALNDATQDGFSSLTVAKNVVVGRGATLILGCEAAFSPCADDMGTPPTLQSRGTVGGSLFATGSLGVLMHNSSVGGAVTEQGGGGGLSCQPKGIFKLFKSPVFSDYEDNVIGDSLIVSGLRSCWLGALRNAVHGSLIFTINKMADPDANEVTQNDVNRSLTCQGNTPAVQYGDGHSTPDVVSGRATGQCGFSRLAPNPAPSGPPEPIAVHATA